MTFQHSIPLGRPEVKLDAQQEQACDRAERKHLLSPAQRGSLWAAVTFANADDARRAQRALDADAERNGRGGRK